MKYTIELNCGNQAFQDDMSGEISRILKALAKAMDMKHEPDEYTPLFDLNGNRIGQAVYDKG